MLYFNIIKAKKIFYIYIINIKKMAL
jgi:hypothetical protein